MQTRRWAWRIGLAAIAILVVLILAVRFFGWDWTGFQPSVDFTGYPHVSVLQPAKTLWDWLQLLIIPGVLALAAAWFNHQESDRDRQQRAQEQSIADERRQQEQAIAQDQRQEAVLEAYLDRILEMIVDKDLRTVSLEKAVRDAAQARTWSVLRRLDGSRKGYVIRFLFESRLINARKAILRLDGADLTHVDLRGAILQAIIVYRPNDQTGVTGHRPSTPDAFHHLSASMGADFKGVILFWDDPNDPRSDHALPPELRTSYVGVDLQGANLNYADLSEAVLGNAQLYRAVLHKANLCEADLTDAFLDQTDLTDATLKNATLTSASLKGANLRGADLTGATLYEPYTAIVYGQKRTMHREADLSDADLSNAVLRNAKVTQEQLNKAKSLAGAIMSDGQQDPKSSC